MMKQFQINPIVRAIRKVLEESGQWRGHMMELIEFAERNGIHIYSKPQQWSKEIEGLEYQLKMIDNIEHGTVKKTSTHIFRNASQIQANSLYISIKHF